MVRGMGKKEAGSGSVELHRMGFGYFDISGKLVLSEIEKRYINEKGIAKIKMGKFPKGLGDAYAVYKYFRARGHMARQAVDDENLLRVWARGVGREEERSELLVKVVDGKWKADFEGLGKLVALAHAARKEIAVARVADGKIEMIKIAKFVD